MQKRLVMENLRSAYNVGNIIRTADALGWGVVFVGYTARGDHKGVKKTALGSQDSIPTMSFEHLGQAQDYMRENGLIISAELSEDSEDLRKFEHILKKQSEHSSLFVVVGNEVTGVEESTLALSDYVVHIPMVGIKESLNVGQSAAIVMRELQHV